MLYDFTDRNQVLLLSVVAVVVETLERSVKEAIKL